MQEPSPAQPHLVVAIVATLLFLAMTGCSHERNEVAVTAPPEGITSSTIELPADYQTIQTAIDMPKTGATILVADGIYFSELWQQNAIRINMARLQIPCHQSKLNLTWLFRQNISGILTQKGQPLDV